MVLVVTIEMRRLTLDTMYLQPYNLGRHRELRLGALDSLQLMQTSATLRLPRDRELVVRIVSELPQKQGSFQQKTIQQSSESKRF